MEVKRADTKINKYKVSWNEIYERIIFTGEHVSMASFDFIYDKVITVNGVSKGYAMTGWRIGYIGAPLWIAKACNKLQGQFTSGVCSIAQRAALAAIRRLVGDRVVTVEGHRLPLPDGQFDVVVIIDYLEHVIEDEAFIAECHRVLKPHGTLIVNTPHLKRSPLHALRRVLGLTDTRHGHVRPGYTANQLFRTLKNGFDVQDVCTYSRCCNQLLDTGIRWISERRGGDHDAVKGTVIGEAEFRRLGKLVRLYRVLYPLLWLAVQLDRLMFFTQGFMLIVRARRRNWIPRAATPVLRDGRSLAEATLGGRIGSAAL